MFFSTAAESLWQRRCDLSRLKYLLSDRFRKSFLTPSLRARKGSSFEASFCLQCWEASQNCPAEQCGAILASFSLKCFRGHQESSSLPFVWDLMLGGISGDVNSSPYPEIFIAGLSPLVLSPSPITPYICFFLLPHPQKVMSPIQGQPCLDYSRHLPWRPWPQLIDLPVSLITVH